MLLNIQPVYALLPTYCTLENQYLYHCMFMFNIDFNIYCSEGPRPKKPEGPSIYYVGIFSGILTPPPLSLIQVPKLKSHPKTKKNIEKSILKIALQKVHSYSFSKICLCMLAF